MNVKAFYEAIEGNYQEALQRMMNDAFIAKMIGKFITNNSFDELVSSYEKKDFDSVFSASHALKGVAGNLGFGALFHQASIITELTREKTPVNLDKQIFELKEQYLKLLEAYRKYLEK